MLSWEGSFNFSISDHWIFSFFNIFILLMPLHYCSKWISPNTFFIKSTMKRNKLWLRGGAQCFVFLEYLPPKLAANACSSEWRFKETRTYKALFFTTPLTNEQISSCWHIVTAVSEAHQLDCWLIDSIKCQCPHCSWDSTSLQIDNDEEGAIDYCVFHPTENWKQYWIRSKPRTQSGWW